jgi:hypothetical protein
MPRYFFNLRTKDGCVRDREGTFLADEASARAHASAVARELMQHRQARTRYWRLDVCDEEKPCFDLLFARIDDSMSHLDPELRRSIESVSATAASLSETIAAVGVSLMQIKATLARTEGAPYLAAIDGVRI